MCKHSSTILLKSIFVSNITKHNAFIFSICRHRVSTLVVNIMHRGSKLTTPLCITGLHRPIMVNLPFSSLMPWPNNIVQPALVHYTSRSCGQESSFFKLCLVWSHKTFNSYFENKIFVYRTRVFISSCAQGTLVFYQVHAEIHLCPGYTGALPCLCQYASVSRVHSRSTRFISVCICVQGTQTLYQVYVSLHLCPGYNGALPGLCQYNLCPGYTGVLPGLCQYISVSRVHRYSTTFVSVHISVQGTLTFYQVHVSIRLSPGYTRVLPCLCQYISVSRVHWRSTRFMSVYICLQSTLVFYHVYVSIHLCPGYTGVLPCFCQYTFVSRVHWRSTRFMSVYVCLQGTLVFNQIFNSMYPCQVYTNVL